MWKPSAVIFLMPASSRTTGSTSFFAARPRIVRTWSSIEAYVADRSAGEAGADGATEPPALGEAVGAGVWLADGDGLTDCAAGWHAATTRTSVAVSAKRARRLLGEGRMAVIGGIVALSLRGSGTQKDRERLPNRRSRSEGGRMEPKGFGPR